MVSTVVAIFVFAIFTSVKSVASSGCGSVEECPAALDEEASLLQLQSKMGTKPAVNSGGIAVGAEDSDADPEILEKSNGKLHVESIELISNSETLTSDNPEGIIEFTYNMIAEQNPQPNDVILVGSTSRLGGAIKFLDLSTLSHAMLVTEPTERGIRVSEATGQGGLLGSVHYSDLKNAIHDAVYVVVLRKGYTAPSGARVLAPCRGVHMRDENENERLWADERLSGDEKPQYDVKGAVYAWKKDEDHTDPKKYNKRSTDAYNAAQKEGTLQYAPKKTGFWASNGETKFICSNWVAWALFEHQCAFNEKTNLDKSPKQLYQALQMPGNDYINVLEFQISGSPTKPNWVAQLKWLFVAEPNMHGVEVMEPKHAGTQEFANLQERMTEQVNLVNANIHHFQVLMGKKKEAPIMTPAQIIAPTQESINHANNRVAIHAGGKKLLLDPSELDPFNLDLSEVSNEADPQVPPKESTSSA